MKQHSNLLKHFSAQSYEQKKITEEFRKPIHENLFLINSLYLKQNSELIFFNNTKWDMRPEVFCVDQYDERYYFYPIILLMNNLSTIFNFTKNNLKNESITAPFLDSILTII